MTSGVVTNFDEDSGLGMITTSEGAQFPFHCVEIADGSRTIVVGTSVQFAVLRKLGRDEASRIRPVRTA
jgi:CspA family cold shock protein